jgi:hypothetical protein
MEEVLMHSGKGMPLYILIGCEDRDTSIARGLLHDAGIEYSFAHADFSDGTLPQLVSGLNTYIGLEQISRLAKQALYNNGHR